MNSIIPEELLNNTDDDYNSDDDRKISASTGRKSNCNINCHCHNKFHRNSHYFARSQLCNSTYRQMYKMIYPDFKKLCEIVTPYFNRILCSNTIRNWTPNDPKTIEVRVACAIRNLAGGSFPEIMILYGISQLFYNESTVLLIEALTENDCPELRKNYKRLFVIAGLNPKSKVQPFTPSFINDIENRYCTL